MRIRFALFLLLIPTLTAGLIIMPGCGKNGEGNVSGSAASVEVAPLVVKAVTVERRDWISTVPFSGNLRSRSIVDVKPEVGGRLVTALVREGDRVQRGQLLAEIDDVNYRLAYDQSEAALKVARAGLERAQVSAGHAKTEKERADNLLRTGGITEKDNQAAATGLKEAESQVRLAEAQCAQAEAALAIAEKALKDCRIFAPFAGQVEKRYFDEGSLLSPGVPLYTLVDNSRLDLECDIPSYFLESIRPGQPAEFSTPAQGVKKFRGVVSMISPTVQPENRSVMIKILVENPGLELRNGMYARGEVITGREKNVPVIPRDALIPERESSDRGSVYVVEEGKAMRRAIRIGGSGKDRVWLLEGLNGGEQVITERGPAIKDGTPVQVVPDSMSSGS